MTFPSFDTQMAAYQRYVDARRKADQTLLFEDCRDAAAAWIGFVNDYLPEEVRMPERRLGTNVAIFPVHLSRSPSRSPE